MKDGEPWFVAKDEDEKGVHTVDTLGGSQKAIIDHCKRGVTNRYSLLSGRMDVYLQKFEYSISWIICLHLNF